jgi:hypothetical protein
MFVMQLSPTQNKYTILEINWFSDCQKFIATENQAIATDDDL